jgi:hypothetical protein
MSRNLKPFLGCVEHYRLLDQFTGKSWRPREPPTGLASPIHSKAQRGPADARTDGTHADQYTLTLIHQRLILARLFCFLLSEAFHQGKLEA